MSEMLPAILPHPLRKGHMFPGRDRLSRSQPAFRQKRRYADGQIGQTDAALKIFIDAKPCCNNQEKKDQQTDSLSPCFFLWSIRNRTVVSLNALLYRYPCIGTSQIDSRSAAVAEYRFIRKPVTAIRTVFCHMIAHLRFQSSFLFVEYYVKRFSVVKQHRYTLRSYYTYTDLCC